MKPVFVGACARSGTTFLGSMLGTHSQCFATPESKFNVEVYLDCLRHSQNVELMVAFDKIKQRTDFSGWGIDLDCVDVAELQRCQGYPDLIKWLVNEYARSLGRSEAKFWIDHTPFNIVYAATLFALYPDAKLIHLVRDGRSVASSVMKLDWGPNTPNTAAYWWINRVAHGLAAESFFGPERVQRIRYEDLVLHPQATLQTICTFLGIDFEPKMVTGAGFRLPEHLAHIHPLVGKQPNTKRIKAWQNELTPRQIEIYESIAGQFLTCLGYDLKFGLAPRPVSAVELLGLWIQEVYSDRIANKFYPRAPGRHVNHKATSDKAITVSS